MQVVSEKALVAGAMLASLLIAECGGGGGGGDSAAVVVAPVALPVSTADQVRAFAAALDATTATVPPASGSAFFSKADPCYLHDGRSRAHRIDDFNASPDAYAHRVGVRTINLVLLSERTVTNSDDTSRLEADVRFDVAFRDGTTQVGAENTYLRGSTSSLCAAGVDSSEWRVLGNRRLADIAVVAVNQRTTNPALLGLNSSSSRLVSRAVRFSIQDPLGNATYAVVSGPRSPLTGEPIFSIKLISTRLLAAYPLFVGKTGNFTNWRLEDGFRICPYYDAGPIQLPIYGTGATRADCVRQGADGFDLGATISSDRSGNFTADAIAIGESRFSNFGFFATAVYTFSLFNDDGWKTVNGQAGRTPIAVYTAKLGQLPYSLATTAAFLSGEPTISPSTATINTAVRAAPGSSGTTAVTIDNLTFATLPDNRRFGWSFAGVLSRGPGPGGSLFNFYPASRTLDLFYPASDASSTTVVIPGTPLSMAQRTQTEVIYTHTDRNGAELRNAYSY